jgi:hypothetical protein
MLAVSVICDQLHSLMMHKMVFQHGSNFGSVWGSNWELGLGLA